MYAVDVEKVTKIYENGTKALDNVSIKIPEGKIYGLLGPNGAGKSTLIAIISAMINKTSGSVKIFGVDNSKEKQYIKTMIGVVPQEVVNEPIFTVYEVLDFFSGMYGVKPKDRKKRIDEVLEILHLSEKRNVRARSLSGGMKRRLMFAKALIHRPKLIILDEPTAGVDVELRKNIWEYVEQLKDDGISIIFTTHYLEEAEKLCEIISIIDEGKVIVEDTQENLRLLFGQTIIYAEIQSEDLELEKFEQSDKIFIDKKEVKIITKEGHESFYIQKLANSGILSKIEIRKTTLEDIFVKLTNGSNK